MNTMGHIQTVEIECNVCKGLKYFYGLPCEKCGATGRIKRTVRVENGQVAEIINNNGSNTPRY